MSGRDYLDSNGYPNEEFHCVVYGNTQANVEQVPIGSRPVLTSDAIDVTQNFLDWFMWGFILSVVGVMSGICQHAAVYTNNDWIYALSGGLVVFGMCCG